MEDREFDTEEAVDCFFDIYKDYALELLPNKVGGTRKGLDEITLMLLDAI